MLLLMLFGGRSLADRDAKDGDVFGFGSLKDFELRSTLSQPRLDGLDVPVRPFRPLSETLSDVFDRGTRQLLLLRRSQQLLVESQDLLLEA